MDAQTLKPIPFVTVISSNIGSSSNLEGLFSLSTGIGDSIYFSHVNYYQKIIHTENFSIDPIAIYLSPKDVLLDEIIVNGLPTEVKLKKQILQTRIQPGKEEVNATNNIFNSRLLYLSGYEPEMNELDNYRNFIQGPQEVTFFSTNSSRGLLKTFKNMSRNRTHFKRPYKTRNPPILNELNKFNKIDEVDSLYKYFPDNQ